MIGSEKNSQTTQRKPAASLSVTPYFELRSERQADSFHRALIPRPVLFPTGGCALFHPIMIRKILVIALLISGAAIGRAAPASEASIRELLALSEAQKLADNVIGQVDKMMHASMNQVVGGKQLSPEQQKIVDGMQAKMIGILKDEMSWDKLEPMYIRVYQQSFTQEEVDGIVAFYKTPAGQAMVKKLPLVVQNSMKEMQGRMGPMMQKIQAAIQETAQEVEAADKK